MEGGLEEEVVAVEEVEVLRRWKTVGIITIAFVFWRGVALG